MGAAVPFEVSYFGAMIGVLLGLPVIVAILVAVIGKAISMVHFVNGAQMVRHEVCRGKTDGKKQQAFDEYYIAGVSHLGQSMLPSQNTCAALVSFGANRQRVLFWQLIFIVRWGTLFGILAVLGLPLLGK